MKLITERMRAAYRAERDARRQARREERERKADWEHQPLAEPRPWRLRGMIVGPFIFGRGRDR